MVVRVEPGGPAEGAGLMIGDVMIAVGGQPVGDADQLQAHLGPDKVGGQLDHPGHPGRAAPRRGVDRGRAALVLGLRIRSVVRGRGDWHGDSG